MNFYDFFLTPYEGYSSLQIALESIGSIFGLLSVYFSTKKNIWVYPTGIISTVIYVYLLFNAGLLGDMMINFYYTVMSIYGWALWSKNTTDHIHIQPSYTTKKEWQFCLGLFILSLVLVGIIYYFKPYIDHHFSMDGVSLGWYHLDWTNYVDIITTAIFLVGMWLMAKQKVENWLFWIIGDLISVPMYLYKGLAITSIQYAIFTVLATIGFLKWQQGMKRSKLQ
ncbi:nicotinamide riboside transporter PnuC [Riemerella columbina]|uniref:nicotinamide riboside transporter PnuC n=1 Tax=Riemerella columbina TaxID=103810 RepID=UPI00266E95AD|nr:nicotinamide riboside transporter PnuC [Riemerella columbina]WKS94457.1 nicotinamide riboside transporter PnuC [Riemerella columbina]